MIFGLVALLRFSNGQVFVPNWSIYRLNMRNIEIYFKKFLIIGGFVGSWEEMGIW